MAKERSADIRTGWFGILLLNTLVAATLMLESRVEPGFILTTQDGNRVRAYAVESSKIALDEQKGFDVRTPTGITRINYNLSGIRKLELLSFKNMKPEPTPIPRPWTWPSPFTNPTGSSSPTIKLNSLDQEFEIDVKIESYSGKLIQGVAVLKGPYFPPKESLGNSFRASTDEGIIELNVLDIRSVERESAVFYEWIKWLF